MKLIYEIMLYFRKTINKFKNFKEFLLKLNNLNLKQKNHEHGFGNSTIMLHSFILYESYC